MADAEAEAKQQQVDLFGSDDDDEEVVGGSAKAKESVGGGGEGDAPKPMTVDDEDDDALFGSGSDSEEKKKVGGSDVDSDEYSEDDSGDDGDASAPVELQGDPEVSIWSVDGAKGEEQVLLKLPTKFVRAEKEAWDGAEKSPGDPAHVGVLRWRPGKGKAAEVESNARLVRWSDGSLSLQVGDKDYEVLSQDVKSFNYFAFARHGGGGGGLLEGCGALETRHTVVPPIKMIASASVKKKKDKVGGDFAGMAGAGALKSQRITVMENPQMMQEEREREEEAKLKEIEKLQKKQEREMAKYGLSSYGDGGGGGYGGGLSVRYLEDEYGEAEEWDADATRRARDSLAGVRSMGSGDGERRILQARDGGDATEEEQSAKRQKFARGLDESDDDGEQREDQDEKRGTRGKAILMSDDED